MKDVERRQLTEERVRIVEDLTLARDDLAVLNARAEDLAGRGGPVSIVRLSLLLFRVARLRARVEALEARLREIGRREVELFEAARLEVGRRWGIGVWNVCSSWPHLEAWERWFEDSDERFWLEVAAEEEGGYPARRREISRQVREYGIHDHARFGPDLDVLPRH